MDTGPEGAVIKAQEPVFVTRQMERFFVRPQEQFQQFNQVDEPQDDDRQKKIGARGKIVLDKVLQV